MKHRRIVSKRGEIYYAPIDIVNPADELHVTDNSSHGSRMQGYGGNTLKFELDDGTVDEVKGPWHTNSIGFFENTGINVGELHLTKVTLWDDGDGTPIYQEKEPVLGHYYRGERIAQQLATLRNKPIGFKSESSGGSTQKVCQPNGVYQHPLSMREADRKKK